MHVAESQSIWRFVCKWYSQFFLVTISCRSFVFKKSHAKVSAGLGLKREEEKKRRASMKRIKPKQWSKYTSKENNKKANRLGSFGPKFGIGFENNWARSFLRFPPLSLATPCMADWYVPKWPPPPLRKEIRDYQASEAVRLNLNNNWAICLALVGRELWSV